MKRLNYSLFILACALLAGCAELTAVHDKSIQNPPMAYHDTRLQYALLTNDRSALAQDFSMKLPPSWSERIVAGVVLPLTASTETAFYPFALGINAPAPAAVPADKRSAQ